MKSLLIVSSLLVSASLMAAPSIPLDQQIASFTVEEVTDAGNKSAGNTNGGSNGGGNRPFPGRINNDGLGFIGGTPGGFTGGTPGGVNGGGTPIPNDYTPYPTDKYERAGQVIQSARDMVAFGEAIYALVQKGKPSNVTEYAPISVVPRDPMTKEIADIFDMEGFSMPVERNFVAKVKNGAGAEVVVFNYKVMYSYGGSYNGTGKYLTNVLIVPGSIKTSFGWDFNATMKLSGMMNHGTKADPIAGIMVTIKYQMNSWSTAFERNDTIHITGAGQLKTYGIK